MPTPLTFGSSNQPLHCDIMPMKGFVHEVLHCSRTSGSVLQIVLCYLDAICAKVPELVSQEKGCLGPLAKRNQLNVLSRQPRNGSCYLDPQQPRNGSWRLAPLFHQYLALSQLASGGKALCVCQAARHTTRTNLLLRRLLFGDNFVCH
ncbi:hypothetical protein EDD22DRAFT_565028 [Suillus occidentalis]|nr:hypothetical protein EDD22DRAFT_565028 [Suillus occidentalis]